MDTLLATFGILIGTLLLILGLVLLAPQVKVHEIEKYSRASWLIRTGAIMAIIGLFVNLISASNDALHDIGIVTGVCGMMSGIITWGHERKQALDNGAMRWDWGSSLTLEMVVFGGTIALVGLVGK